MRIRKKVWNNDAEPIIAIMVILMVLGTINVFSSSFVLGTTDYETPYHFLRRHVFVMAGGVVLFFIDGLRAGNLIGNLIAVLSGVCG